MTVQPSSTAIGAYFAAGPGSGGKQRNVPAAKVELSEIVNLHKPTAKIYLGAERTAGSQGRDFIDRKLPLCQYIQHFAPDIAGGPDNCDSVSHNQSIIC